MGLFDRLYLRWRRLPGDQRRHYSQHFYWVSLYLVFLPAVMYFMVSRFYDMQTEIALRSTIPEEISQENFEKWLKKQQAEGRFLDEK